MQLNFRPFVLDLVRTGNSETLRDWRYPRELRTVTLIHGVAWWSGANFFFMERRRRIQDRFDLRAKVCDSDK